MHLESQEGFSIELVGQDSLQPVISDSIGDQFEILGPGHAHPYCRAAEDAFAMANAKKSLEPLGAEIPLLVHLRNLRDGTYRAMNLKALLARKSVGVEACIVIEPEIIRGLLCTLPNPHCERSVVYRPFQLRNCGYTINRSMPGGYLVDHSLVASSPALILPDWISRWRFASDDLTGNFNGSFDPLDGQIISSYILPDSLESSPIDLHDPASLNLHMDSQRRVFYRAISPAFWLRHTKKNPSSDRLGWDLCNAKPTFDFHELVEGRLIRDQGRASFFPIRGNLAPEPVLTRILQLKS